MAVIRKSFGAICNCDCARDQGTIETVGCSWLTWTKEGSSHGHSFFPFFWMHGVSFTSITLRRVKRSRPNLAKKKVLLPQDNARVVTFLELRTATTYSIFFRSSPLRLFPASKPKEMARQGAARVYLQKCCSGMRMIGFSVGYNTRMAIRTALVVHFYRLLLEICVANLWCNAHILYSPSFLTSVTFGFSKVYELHMKLYTGEVGSVRERPVFACVHTERRQVEGRLLEEHQYRKG
ncbi:hypothetical protein J6590_030918 [Homalodisca vitripennis]|nr:hypothetical protein J6590_030918 [Homalodisca vitripennis]